MSITKSEETERRPASCTGRHLFHAWIFLSAVLCFAGSGCTGSGTGSTVPAGTVQAEVIVETDQQLPTAPHLFDVYRATNADKAIVFLHGGLGNKHHMAYQVGLIPNDVKGDYTGVRQSLILENKVLAVFPQGQAIAESPKAYTWSNHVMTSGQNDVQFLRDLVSYISERYGITRFFIAGHSNGGMMVNRLWCEAPELFDRYVSIAGPPSEHFLNPETACTPAQVKPYLAIVGSNDNMLQVVDNWEQPTWTINPIFTKDVSMLDPVMIGERYFLPSRAAQRCGETVLTGDTDAVTAAALTIWSFCNDSIKLVRVQGGTHATESLESVSGQKMFNFVVDFISTN
jgi:poly(3-hydroxybutyrate) depolymerase